MSHGYSRQRRTIGSFSATAGYLHCTLLTSNLHHYNTESRGSDVSKYRHLGGVEALTVARVQLYLSDVIGRELCRSSSRPA